jgi:hypothetical protein
MISVMKMLALAEKFTRMLSMIVLVSISVLSGCDGKKYNKQISKKAVFPVEVVAVDLPGGRCTGIKIDDFNAFTAAHCLFGVSGEKFVGSDSIRVLRNPSSEIGSQRVLRARISSGFDPSKRTLNNTNFDIALLTFGEFLPHGNAQEDFSDQPIHIGEKLFASYFEVDGDDYALITTSCEVLAKKNRVLLLDCPLDFGASGAPVYRTRLNGTADLVAVVVAKARWKGKTVTISVLGGVMSETHEFIDAS